MQSIEKLSGNTKVWAHMHTQAHCAQTVSSKHMTMHTAPEKAITWILTATVAWAIYTHHLNTYYLDWPKGRGDYQWISSGQCIQALHSNNGTGIYTQSITYIGTKGVRYRWICSNDSSLSHLVQHKSIQHCQNLNLNYYNMGSII